MKYNCFLFVVLVLSPECSIAETPVAADDDDDGEICIDAPFEINGELYSLVYSIERAAATNKWHPGSGKLPLKFESALELAEGSLDSMVSEPTKWVCVGAELAMGFVKESTQSAVGEDYKMARWFWVFAFADLSSTNLEGAVARVGVYLDGTLLELRKQMQK